MSAPELSETERQIVARFDAAPDLPESIRERLAKTLFPFMPPIPAYNLRMAMARDAADSALSVLRPVHDGPCDAVCAVNPAICRGEL